VDELISKKKIDNIVQKFSKEITSETTSEQLIEIIQKIIYQSINSIDISVISNIVAGKILRGR